MTIGGWAHCAGLYTLLRLSALPDMPPKKCNLSATQRLQTALTCNLSQTQLPFGFCRACWTFAASHASSETSTPTWMLCRACISLVRFAGPARHFFFAGPAQLLCFSAGPAGLLLFWQGLLGFLSFFCRACSAFCSLCRACSACDCFCRACSTFGFFVQGLLDFCSQPGFIRDIYTNLDCRIERSNMFEAVCALLSKTAFPVNCPLGAVHLLSMEGLFSILSALAKG